MTSLVAVPSIHYPSFYHLLGVGLICQLTWFAGAHHGPQSGQKLGSILLRLGSGLVEQGGFWVFVTLGRSISSTAVAGANLPKTMLNV